MSRLFSQIAHRAILSVLATGLMLMAGVPVAHAASPNWVTSWSAPPDQPGDAMGTQTVRQVVRMSVGGSSLRLRFSNAYGNGNLMLGPVYVARHAGGSAIDAGAIQPILFDGKPTVTIPGGGSVLSDPAAFRVRALESIAISLFLPSGASVPTLHGAGLQTAYLSPGNVAAAVSLADPRTESERYFLSDVDVAASPGAAAFVAIGDSLVDGVASTLDGNSRWPDQLATRLQADPATANIAVINSGIAGNPLLKSAPPFIGESVLDRFDRDALDKPGVRWVLLLAGGVNDIATIRKAPPPNRTASAEEVIDGYKTLIARAHARGVKIWGATIPPWRGNSFFADAPGELATRDAINDWIRSSGAFDAVVDFDVLLKDPADPGRLLPAQDSGDHLHPGDAGYRAMANAIDLKLFLDQ